MFLQVAIDSTNCDHALESINIAFQSGADVVEIGTPLIANCGLSFIRRVREQHPIESLYVDTKSIDFPHAEVGVAYSLGASTASVMAIMADENIIRALDIARYYHRELAISTMGYPPSLLLRRVRELCAIGCNLFVAHGQGIEPATAFNDLLTRIRIIGNEPRIRVICAGGISAKNIALLLSFRPAGIIVGRGVTTAEHPSEEIVHLKSLLRENYFLE